MRNKNKLRYRTICEINREHNNLLDTGYGYIFKCLFDYICSAKGWWTILSLMVSIIYSLSLIPPLECLSWLNFIEISSSSAHVVTDQLTSNIAAVISISLVVIGLLISNLAIKGTISYKLLFRDSKLYLIFYYSISLLACLFVISYLRETISPELISRLSIICTYLALLGLLLIGYLFKQIIKYTSDDYMSKLMHNAFMKESKENIKLHLIKQFSNKIFIQEMENMELSRYNEYKNYWSKENKFRYSCVSDYHEVNNSNNKFKTLYDINLQMIKSFVNKQDKSKGEIVYNSGISIGNDLNLNNSVVWQEGVKSKRKLGFEVFKSNGKDCREINEEFKRKCEKYSESDNYSDLRKVLDSYYELHNLCDKFEIEDNIILSEISNVIRKALKESIAISSITNFKVLIQFMTKIRYLGLYNNRLLFFKKYVNFPIFIYRDALKIIAENRILSKEMKEECTEWTSNAYKNIINGIGVLSEDNTVEMQELLNPFYSLSYESFAFLLYEMLKNKDYESFANALEEYSKIDRNNLERDYAFKSDIRELKQSNIEGVNNEQIKVKIKEYQIQEAFAKLWKTGIVGIKSWLFFLFRMEIYDKNELDKYIKLIDIKFKYIDSNLDEILNYRDYSSIYSMGFRSWDFKERSGMYSPPQPRDWLLSGILLDKLRNDKLYFHRDFIESEYLKEIKSMYDASKSFLEALKFDEWSDILNMKTKEELKEKCDKLLEEMALYKNKLELKTIKAISTSELSESKLQTFRSEVGESWEASSFIRNIFKAYENLNTVDIGKLDKSFIAINQYFEKIKSNFIDGPNHQHIGGFSYLGDEVAKGENRLFFNNIINSNNASITEETVLEVLDRSIARIQNKDKKPDIIFMSHNAIYADTRLIESNKYVRNENVDKSSSKINSISVGSYDNILIIKTSSMFIKDKILVCDFASAFKMNIETNTEWYEDSLIVEVRKLGDDEAKNILSENPEKWKEIEGVGQLSEEEALELVKTSVAIKVGTKTSFGICDEDSFVVGEVVNSIDVNV